VKKNNLILIIKEIKVKHKISLNNNNNNNNNSQFKIKIYKKMMIHLKDQVEEEIIIK
jgi:hypothetical protein